MTMNHTIRIEKIIHGGRGLGRLNNGIIVMTSFVLPGEEVVITEKNKQRGFIEAETVKILNPSPDRVEPPCPYYMRCGGCDLQHMSLEAQHAAKESITRDALNRAGVPAGERIISNITPSPQPFHYRYRIRLKVSLEGAIGFHQAGSNSIVDVEYCQVATELLNNALRELRDSRFPEIIAPHAGEIELLHSPADNRIFCVVHPHRGNAFPLEKLSKILPAPNLITAVGVKKGRKVEMMAQSAEGDTLRQDFAASICGHEYSLIWTPGCFSQVNAEQNAMLIRQTCRLAGESQGKDILELFCGMGNFSIPLALRGAVVTGIERHEECIAQAIRNGSRLGLDNTRFFDRDVHTWVRKAIKYSKKYGTILLDPPRQGMGKDIVLLTELLPSRIIYISCDPATLARDIALLEKHDYHLSSLAPFDMFPQTHHTESVALLEKN